MVCSWNCNLTDGELISATLNGLGNEYSNFISIIDQVEGLFEALEHKLLSEEQK